MHATPLSPPSHATWQTSAVANTIGQASVGHGSLQIEVAISASTKAVATFIFPSPGRCAMRGAGRCGRCGRGGCLAYPSASARVPCTSAGMSCSPQYPISYELASVPIPGISFATDCKAETTLHWLTASSWLTVPPTPATSTMQLRERVALCVRRRAATSLVINTPMHSLLCTAEESESANEHPELPRQKSSSGISTTIRFVSRSSVGS